MTNRIAILILVVNLLFLQDLSAQGIRKPSPLRASAEDFAEKPITDQDFIRKVNSRAEFDTYARTFHRGTPYAVPHIMFLIDLGDVEAPYYINSRKYQFHSDFAWKTHLSVMPQQVFDKLNYSNEHRSFVLGTIAFQQPLNRWTFEYWEGDVVPANLVELTDKLLNKTFFTPLSFKPNSILQEENSSKLKISRLSAAEINRGQEYLGMNEARAVGRIRIVESLDDSVEVSPEDILVLNETPFTLPPIRGLILSKLSSPLSHINLLAHGWDIPNAFVSNAVEKLRKFDRQWVYLETKIDSYQIRAAEEKEIAAVVSTVSQKRFPVADLAKSELRKLSDLRIEDKVGYGAKAANLGELFSQAKKFTIPQGISVPYLYYKKYFEKNGLDKELDELLSDAEFQNSPRVRRERLALFRSKVVSGTFDEELRQVIISKWNYDLGGKPVFVRSSSNAEDLPDFNAAGLYDSVPNVTNGDEIIKAVKTVWASTWNFAAFEARKNKRVDQHSTYMSALIQVAIDMECGGVMITADPFDKNNVGAVYIAASEGHNSTVTGKPNVVPEQILFAPKSNSFQLLTQSSQEKRVAFNEKGGLEDLPMEKIPRVLSDDIIRKLVKVSRIIRSAFNGVDQDIEWGYLNGTLYILQSRPYIAR